MGDSEQLCFLFQEQEDLMLQQDRLSLKEEFWMLKLEDERVSTQADLRVSVWVFHTR